ncbi:hypothetical protein [Bremerella cremea]|uniref:hypothetical protein n=1 Tax=Bremerella cremea TaxID=1031537 RepID=UPI0031F11B25
MSDNLLSRRPIVSLLGLLLLSGGTVGFAAPRTDEDASFVELVVQLRARRHHVVVSSTEPNTIQDLELNTPDNDDFRLLQRAQVTGTLIIREMKNKVVGWDEVLQGCRQLTRVTFMDCTFADDRIDFLAACPALTHVSLVEDCPLDGRSLTVLKDLPKLEYFGGDCKSVNAHSMVIPEDHPTLFDFHVHGVPIDKSNFQRLMGLSKIKYIRLADNGTTDAHLEGVIPSVSLESVDILSGISDHAGTQFREQHDNISFLWDE